MVRVMGRLLLSVLFVAAWCGPVLGADSKSKSDSTTVRKTEEGLHFQLPPDWPVEKRNGMVTPIPVEEYVSRKFAAIESRLQELEKQIGGFDLRLRVIEEQGKKNQGLKSVEQGP